MSRSPSGKSSLQEELRVLQTKFSDSLTKDEALNFALEAAELHMKFLRLATSKTEKSELGKKCKSLLDEAERIKGSDSWLKEDEPLIDIGPAQVVAVPPAPTQKSKSLLRSPASNPTATGENQWFDEINVLSSEPVSSRILTDAEQLLLSKSAKINGILFPAYSPPRPDQFLDQDERNAKFTDPTTLKMSVEQLSFLDDWKRPEEALPPPLWARNIPLTVWEQQTKAYMVASNLVDLVQDAATDCSIVASMSAGIARAERGFPDILSIAVQPFDVTEQHPSTSSNGKYIVRLNVNGCYRQVTIDDRLPVSKTARVLHVFDRNNPRLLWPALLEKAYLKVRGGYDFPGSNSGTDLWVLTGWIPEQIFLQHNDTDAEKLWSRIFKAFGYGDILITLGTGVMTSDSEKELGLVGEHDYAVIDLEEANGRKRMLTKNPWLEATTWKEYHVPSETIDKQIVERTSLEVGDVAVNAIVQRADSRQTTPGSKHSRTRILSPGMFWMDVGNIMQNFESVYLNWNPSLFKYRQDTHFNWSLTPGIGSGRSCPGSFTNNPQYAVKTTRADNVWLLLAKHFSGDASTIDKKEAEGYISLYAFDNGGNRCFLSRSSLKKTPYVDSPQILLTLWMEPQKTYTIVVSEQGLKQTQHAFTLSAFSRVSLTVDSAPSRFPRQAMVHSSWNHGNSGGNSSSPKYSQNPQFVLALSASSAICIMLETAAPGLRVHAKLLHGQGQRAFSVTNRDVIIDTGSYRRGCAFAETQDALPAGKYTLICSTFDADQVGDFTLRVASATKATLAPIAREGAGRIRQSLAAASFGFGVRAVATPVAPKRLATINFAARYVPSVTSSNMDPTGHNLPASAHSPLRMTLELGRGPMREILIASGQGSFRDDVSGIRTEDVTLRPEMAKTQDVWLVLERLGIFDAVNRPEERVSVDMFTDVADPAAFGVWRDWDR